MAKILVVFESNFDNQQHMLDALDFTMASTGYAHQTSVLFSGAGVNLLAAPNDKNSRQKSPAKIIASFPFYDIDDLYVCSDSLVAFNNNNTVYTDLDIIEVNSSQIDELIAQHDHVARF